MAIITTAISIFAVTILVWLLNKILPFKICPICAGVSGTWLWMFTGMAIGQLPTSDFQLPTSILMGGSVVGIVYQLEKRPAFAKATAGKLLLWKMLFIPVGFLAVYSLLFFWWGVSALVLLWLLGVAVVFLQSSVRIKEEDKKVKELEKQMEKCC